MYPQGKAIYIPNFRHRHEKAPFCYASHILVLKLFSFRLIVLLSVDCDLLTNIYYFRCNNAFFATKMNLSQIHLLV